jgi:hypothetical protein
MEERKELETGLIAKRANSTLAFLGGGRGQQMSGPWKLQREEDHCSLSIPTCAQSSCLKYLLSNMFDLYV